MRRALGVALLMAVVAAVSLVPLLGQAHPYDGVNPPAPVPNLVHCHGEGGHGSLYVDIPATNFAPGVHGTETNFTPSLNERHHNGEMGCNFLG